MRPLGNFEDPINWLYRKTKEDNALRAEQLRENIDTGAILDELAVVYDSIDEIEIRELPRLALKSNILLALLKKTIPDLKAVEIKEKINNYSRLIIQHNTPTRDDGDEDF
jgi:hypothetical protein